MKSDIIKKLVNEKPVFNKEIEDTYIKRLEEGQLLIDSLIEQSSFALKLLKSELLHHQHTNDKQQVIAEYKRNEIIPFYQDKNDVISISTASILIQSLIQQHVNSSKNLQSLNNQEFDTINNLKGFKMEYQQLLDNLDEISQFKKDRSHEITHSNEFDLTNNEKIQQLNDLVDTTDNDLQSLNNALKKVVFKYVSFDDTSLSVEEIKSRVTQLIELINKLIKNLITNKGFTPIDPNPVQQSLIRNLIMNDIILSDLSDDMLIQLRDYSR
ncbi:hypothetical protein CLIB1444_10S04258 [[Candida] jaroonii]|uniref:Uncharacterized protein n=1 Tax=[Candida] jaroonii TaxID=467808 RepID=A0ACA9YDN0_9ASCO|nr:hypothetical protein CLIB1444_10S04258 [[Candida] jaroonii]